MNNNAYRNIYLLNIGLGLLILGFLIHYYHYFSKTSKSNFEHVETYIKAFDNNFEKESNEIINLLPDVSFEYYSKFDDNEYILLTYKNDSLVFWNKNSTTISKEYIKRLSNNKKLIQLNNGYYYIHTKNKQIGRNIYTIAGLLPVYYTFEVESKYLKKKFNDAFKLGKLFDFVLKDNGEIPLYTTHINQTNGDYLFSIAVNKNELKKYSFLSILLFIAGLLTILFYINNLALAYLKEDKLQAGYGIIVSGIVLIGFIIFLLDYVPGFNDLQLFDPSLYASSKFSGSLGDLFLSLVLITWLITFLYRTINFKPLDKININGQIASHFGFAIIFAFGGIYISKIIASLVIDSTIDFDVFAFLDSSNLNNLLLALICMVLLLTIFYCLFNTMQKINNVIEIKDYYKLLSITIALIIAFLFDFWLAKFLQQSYNYLYFAFSVLLVTAGIIFQYYGKNKSLNFSKNLFFVWLTFSALFIAVYIFVLDNEKEKDHRKLLAKQLAKGHDPNIEYQLSGILSNLEKDPYLSEFVTSRFILKKTFDDEILSKYFSNYLGQFEIVTHVYSNRGYHIKGNGNGPQKEELTLKILSDGRDTFDPNLTVFRDKANQYQYIGRVAIKDSINEIGNLYIQIEPKAKGKILVYPELMQSAVQNYSIEVPSEYSYAFYEKNKLEKNSAIKLTGQNGFFEYPNYYKDRFEIPDEQMVFKDIEGHSHLIYKIPLEDDLYLILSKDRFNAVKLVSLFSFIYAIVIVFFGTLWLVYIFINALITHSSPFKYFFSSFSNRLNGAMIALLLFSFVLTGAIITYFLVQQFENYDNSRLLAKKEAVETRLKSEIADQRLKNSDFVIKISPEFMEALATSNLSKAEKETAIKKELNKKAEKIKMNLDSLSSSLSKIHGVDINIFNIDGDLIGSSLRTTRNKDLSPEKLSPAVLKKLVINDHYETQQSEKIGELAYTSFYFQLKNNINDKQLSIINIPYYTSTDKTTENNVAEFILALINVYVFLFILGSLLALLLSKTLTSSLTKVSEKMGSYRLGQKHDPIEWYYDDEIGKLINGYNQMTQEVEISANLLAQSERQTAWREMARQVAHEIKNPLTPMKLSIQHLQRSLKDNNPNAKELTTKVTKTLVEQIENLANIASQFSSFAKMPEAQNSIININELIGNVLPLYEGGSEGATINYNSPKEAYWIFSDRNRLVQVFNNLIKNAIQSIPSERKGIINVQSVKQNGEVYISIKDNGSGIPVAIQHKVFTPNFTTKGSGMGLGLAITKQIIEQSNGKIYFETALEEGTTFYIQLPSKEKAELENLSTVS